MVKLNPSYVMFHLHNKLIFVYNHNISLSPTASLLVPSLISSGNKSVELFVVSRGGITRALGPFIRIGILNSAAILDFGPISFAH